MIKFAVFYRGIGEGERESTFRNRLTREKEGQQFFGLGFKSDFINGNAGFPKWPKNGCPFPMSGFPVVCMRKLVVRADFVGYVNSIVQCAENA